MIIVSLSLCSCAQDTNKEGISKKANVTMDEDGQEQGSMVLNAMYNNSNLGGLNELATEEEPNIEELNKGLEQYDCKLIDNDTVQFGDGADANIIQVVSTDDINTVFINSYDANGELVEQRMVNRENCTVLNVSYDIKQVDSSTSDDDVKEVVQDIVENPISDISEENISNIELESIVEKTEGTVSLEKIDTNGLNDIDAYKEKMENFKNKNMPEQMITNSDSENVTYDTEPTSTEASAISCSNVISLKEVEGVDTIPTNTKTSNFYLQYEPMFTSEPLTSNSTLSGYSYLGCTKYDGYTGYLSRRVYKGDLKYTKKIDLAKGLSMSSVASAFMAVAMFDIVAVVNAVGSVVRDGIVQYTSAATIQYQNYHNIYKVQVDKSTKVWYSYCSSRDYWNIYVA